MKFFRPRIDIVEDNEAVREGFALIFNSISKFYVVGSAYMVINAQ